MSYNIHEAYKAGKDAAEQDPWFKYDAILSKISDAMRVRKTVFKVESTASYVPKDFSGENFYQFIGRKGCAYMGIKVFSRKIPGAKGNKRLLIFRWSFDADKPQKPIPQRPKIKKKKKKVEQKTEI
jgi:hypothetical protein